MYALQRVFLVLLVIFATLSVSNPVNAKAWQPTIADFDKNYDWLKTTSGEWLKGDLITMYNDEVEFDSSEFGIQTIDLADIAEIYSKGYQSIRLNDGTVLTGKLIVKDKKFTIINNDKTSTYNINQLLAIASVGDRELDYWNGEINFGTNFRRGNSEQSDFTFAAKMKRRTSSSRFNLDYQSNMSERVSSESGEQEKTANDQRLTSSFDCFFSPKLFIRLVDYEFYADEFNNIDQRHTAGIAVGYKLTDTDRVTWEVNAGPSLQSTQYIQVPDDEDDSETSGVISLGTSINWDITKDIEFGSDYQLQVVNEDAGDLIHRFSAGFDVDLIADFELDLTLYLDRIENPKSTGEITPEKNDYRLVFSLGYEL